MLLRVLFAEEDRSFIFDPWLPTVTEIRASPERQMLLMGLWDATEGFYLLTEEGTLLPTRFER